MSLKFGQIWMLFGSGAFAWMAIDYEPLHWPTLLAAAVVGMILGWKTPNLPLASRSTASSTWAAIILMLGWFFLTTHRWLTGPLMMGFPLAVLAFIIVQSRRELSRTQPPEVLKAYRRFRQRFVPVILVILVAAWQMGSPVGAMYALLAGYLALSWFSLKSKNRSIFVNTKLRRF